MLTSSRTGRARVGMSLLTALVALLAVAACSSPGTREHQFNIRELGGPGPNGVAVADGLVYGDTNFTAFALSAKNGKTVWVDRTLLGTDHGIAAGGKSASGLYGPDGVFDIQPQVIAGQVYLSSVIGSGPGGGILFALSAATGTVIWKFSTMAGSDTTGRAVGAGGAWEPPLVGSDGSVTFGIGNPYESPAQSIADGRLRQHGAHPGGRAGSDGTQCQPPAACRLHGVLRIRAARRASATGTRAHVWRASR